ncbi:MAG TPA: macro domain-containing protein [Gemmatimonadaceae bacterium]|nr:macro domain-containing protein [Gemmatimonadaceae bacterium]
MGIEIIRADITTLDVDAIVNAANSALAGGGGVDGAIHRAAGPALLKACRVHGRCPPGGAVITPAFRLPSRYVIHAVGPADGDAEVLERTYGSVFRVAAGQGDIRTIAFPAISTGAYGFPKRQAAEIALGVMRRHEDEYDRIVAVLFDDESVAIYRELQT